MAISRAVSLETLEIRGFSSNKYVRHSNQTSLCVWNSDTDGRVMAHPRVIKWAAPLEDAQANEEEWDDLLANHEFDEAI